MFWKINIAESHCLPWQWAYLGLTRHLYAHKSFTLAFNTNSRRSYNLVQVLSLCTDMTLKRSANTLDIRTGQDYTLRQKRSASLPSHAGYTYVCLNYLDRKWYLPNTTTSFCLDVNPVRRFSSRLNGLSMDVFGAYSKLLRNVLKQRCHVATYCQPNVNFYGVFPKWNTDSVNLAKIRDI